MPTHVAPTEGVSLVASEAQVAAWNLLVEKYGARLPYYTYHPKPAKITDVWVEWTTGLNGCLSGRELEEGWGPAWRRNVKTVKTERSRRLKIINLIEKLAAKRNWNLELALRFIRDRYEEGRAPGGQRLFPTVRSFIDYLQKQPKEGELSATDRILFESNSYTG
ncbi:hypothetical protein C8R47DRAFT_1168239 [Mycena vitilis]|nr:hypothetical protein C8R47DRAFT_1168239 [Mycena vitilis]